MVIKQNKKETIDADQVAEFLVRLFENNDISAIVHIPKFGTMTIVQSEIGRSRVLERAELEIKSDQFAIEYEAKQLHQNKLLNSAYKTQTIKSREYIG